MPTRRIIGVAAGSGAAGIDAALVEIDGIGLELTARFGPIVHQPFGKDLQEALYRAQTSDAADVRQQARIHRLVGETAAAAARATADEVPVPLHQTFCIGWKGFPLWMDSDPRLPGELRLGMTAVVAERTGVTTIGDFTASDLAVGGQGGPLAALPDFLLFRHPRESRLLVHLGRSARIVYLPAAARPADVVAVEAGPATGLLDSLMRQVTGGRESFDPGGKHAVQGRCLEPLLDRWLGHTALQRRPPRLFTRADFGADFAFHAVEKARELGGTPHDLLCTATAFVARSVALACSRFLPGVRCDRILLSGGGVRNGLLWRLLDRQFDGLTLERTDAVGVPAAGREASAVAIHAALTLDGVPGNLPSATGAVNSRLLGTFCPGNAENWSRCVAWMAAQSVARAAA